MRIRSLRWVKASRKPNKRTNYRWSRRHNSILTKVRSKLHHIAGFFLHITGCKPVTVVAWTKVSLVALLWVTGTVKMRRMASNLLEVLRACLASPITSNQAPRSLSRTRTTKARLRSKLAFHSNWLPKASSIRRGKPHLLTWFLFKKSRKLSSQLMMNQQRMVRSARTKTSP